jgi:chromosome segregation ATPase
VKIQEDQIAKLTQRYQEDEAQWKEDKQELTAKIQDLYIALDKTKREANHQIQALQAKAGDYKSKVKQANNSINTLAQRLAVSELNREMPPSNSSP